jgi:dihydrofolate synthase/folylpolyglutamate synthase
MPPRSSSARRPRPAARYLASRTRLGVKFGLEIIRALVERLGHPERAFSSLLVAGTNGKGSVVAYADAVLRASGLRVGRYTSPHLSRVNERIAVDGREITDSDLDRAVERVRAAAAQLVRGGTIAAHPTYFEAITAAAFVHFQEQEVDVAVLEVGMGGRLDATNVVEPLASAIVSVDLDHEAYLGDTPGAIAREKAGVLRAGRPTVLGPLLPEAREAVALSARGAGARLVDARAGALVQRGESGLDVVTPRAEYRGLRPLPGAHQVDNALVALRLLEEARDSGLACDLERAAAAIGEARWPGRLERVEGRPAILLDGAHNPAAARALADHLRGIGPFVLVFGAMRDKDVRGMAEILFPLARAVVLTRPGVDRAARPAEIARRAGPVGKGARLEASPRKALAWARAQAGADATVVVAGSLFLVGELRPFTTASRASAAGAASRPRRALRRRSSSPTPARPRRPSPRRR